MARLAASRLSATGRAVVPAEVRKRLGLRPGDFIAFEERNGEFVIRRWLMPQCDDPFGTFYEWASPDDDDVYVLDISSAGRSATRSS